MFRKKLIFNQIFIKNMELDYNNPNCDNCFGTGLVWSPTIPSTQKKLIWTQKCICLNKPYNSNDYKKIEKCNVCTQSGWGYFTECWKCNYIY